MHPRRRRKSGRSQASPFLASDLAWWLTTAWSDIVYSQPADTGKGQDVNTQLVYAVSHLKSHGNPMRLQDLAIITELPLDTDRVLLEKFRAHDRVVHDPKTDLYSYRVCISGLLPA